MNGSVNTETGIRVHLSEGGGIPPATLKIGGPMLEKLLEEADAPAGIHVFQVAGRYSRFESVKGNCVEVALGNDPSSILIRVRARHGDDGSFFGYLRLLPGIGRERLFRDLEAASKNFNDEGWKSVIDNIPPEPAPPRGVSVAPKPILASPPAPVATRDSEVASARPSASHSANLSERQIKLVQLLQSLLNDPKTKNGVFMGTSVMAYAEPIFPKDRSPGWIARLLAELENSQKWIRRVGQGQYQVEVEFARVHVPSAIIRPLDKMKRHPPAPSRPTVVHDANAKKNGKEEKDRTVSEPPPQVLAPAIEVNSGDPLAQLTQRLKEVQDLIEAERKKHLEAIAAARAELATAQGKVEFAEGAFAAFNQQVEAVMQPFKEASR